MEHQSCQDSSMKLKKKKLKICQEFCNNAHRLNLVLVDVSRKVQNLHEIIGILEAYTHSNHHRL